MARIAKTLLKSRFNATDKALIILLCIIVIE